MRTFAIANQKGGSGKTTTSVNLAAALGELGRRVLVVDLDPQHSATAWFGIKNAGKEVLGIFNDNGDLADMVREAGAPGVDFLLMRLPKDSTGAEAVDLAHRTGRPVAAVYA
ncbi:MAG: ParA family protein, partial [Desulfobaccales bacterium]